MFIKFKILYYVTKSNNVKVKGMFLEYSHLKKLKSKRLVSKQNVDFNLETLEN